MTRPAGPTISGTCEVVGDHTRKSGGKRLEQRERQTVKARRIGEDLAARQDIADEILTRNITRQGGSSCIECCRDTDTSIPGDYHVCVGTSFAGTRDMAAMTV